CDICTITIGKPVRLSLSCGEMCYPARMADDTRKNVGMHPGKESAMAERSDLWTLHLVSQLSQVPQGLDEDVLRRVRAMEGVTSVAVVPSSDASTHLAFSTRYSQVVAAANEAKQCLQEALDAPNATVWWVQRKEK